MKLFSTTPWIVISDAPIGYQVEVAPVRDAYYEERFDRCEFAQAYARGLSWATGWVVEDQSSASLAQWGCA